MFTVGIGIYGVGTLLAAVSWNIAILTLGWSIIEGIAAALIMPLAMTLIFFNYKGANRAIAFGILGGVQASAAAVGPILGGFLTTFASWRWGFGLQVIIVIVIFFFVPYIRESDRDESIQLDIWGTVISATGLALIVTGFLLAGQYGFWTARRPFTIGNLEINHFGLSPTPFLIGLGVIVLVGFVHWQRHLVATGRSPLLRPEILKNIRFMAGVTTDSFRQLALTGLLFIVPVYAQSALGFSAMESGLAILPFSAATFILSMTTADLASRIAPKWLILGGLVTFGAGLIVLWAVTTSSMGIADFIIPMALMGVGIGLVVAQIVNLTISQVRDDQRNEGSGTHNTFRELGGSLGTALIGAVLLVGAFTGFTDGALKADNIQLPPSEREALAVQVEDALNQVSEEDQKKLVDSLTPEQQQQLGGIVSKALVDLSAARSCGPPASSSSPC